MASATEIAWAAGFFDGEGSTVSPTNRRGQWDTVGIGMCLGQKGTEEHPPSTLMRFRDAVGVGALRKDFGSGVFMWRWAVGAEADVRIALKQLWPQLSDTKRQQALDALTRRADFLTSVADRKLKVKRQSDCHPDKSHQGHGVCRTCFARAKYRRLHPGSKHRAAV